MRLSEVLLQTTVKSNVLPQLFFHTLLFPLQLLNSSSQCVDLIPMAGLHFFAHSLVRRLKPFHLFSQVA